MFHSIDDILKTYNLTKVITDLSADIDKTIIDLSNIFKRYYTVNSRQTKFYIIESLANLIRRHAVYATFYNNDEIDELQRKTIEAVMVETIYSEGYRRLTKKGSHLAKILPIMVFICYAREDLEEAKRLCDSLKIVGLDPWFDKESLMPGQKWEGSY